MKEGGKGVEGEREEERLRRGFEGGDRRGRQSGRGRGKEVPGAEARGRSLQSRVGGAARNRDGREQLMSLELV